MTAVEVRQQLLAGDWVFWSRAEGKELLRVVLRVVYAGEEFSEDNVLISDGLGAEKVYARPEDVRRAF